MLWFGRFGRSIAHGRVYFVPRGPNEICLSRKRLEKAVQISKAMSLTVTMSQFRPNSNIVTILAQGLRFLVPFFFSGGGLALSYVCDHLHEHPALLQYSDCIEKDHQAKQSSS